jgi:hypothetical protein
MDEAAWHASIDGNLTAPWGPIRSAYLKGPGNLTIELEQDLEAE